MFEIFTSDKNDKFYFHLKAENGQIILASQAYEAKSSAQNGVQSVIDNAQDSSRYERKTASNGKFYFNLKSGNGQVVGSSQMYSSEAGMQNGINSVKNNAAKAVIKDLTVD
ncbi:YegP family protein [Galbibacter sp. EGI 63066]|uniref:YegP family protein n=1 Tax=Galbibacter sp. EGI 63066 TaxID=2993559 RepID=UPI0022492119|nr:YegP family protein [Galbibacter sp. EGI 63066]MCX2678741.1 YegP family protein [Galbibacter sp. EGI 63066]